MGASDDVHALRARILELEQRSRELEDRNRELAAAARRPETGRAPAGGRARTAVAVVLVVVSVLLAPVAALGTWARLQLVDTDRFVQTFAPLAEQPAVQSLVTDQVVQGIEENVDVDGLVSDLFAGIEELDLPPRAKAAVPLLQGPAAEGMRSLIRTGVEQLVSSPQFAQLWEGALRETHGRAVAVIQGDPNAALQLSEDGTLSLQLSSVIREVKDVLAGRGLGFAESIPEIDRAIPILTADSLVLVRTVYQIAVAAGYWLPWIVLALLGVGVALARDRPRALAWAGAGLTVSFLLLAAGLGIGKQFFAGAVSPSIMPAATAHLVFDQLTLLMSSTILAMVVLSIFLALGGWMAGGSRPARAIRGAAETGFSAARGAADRRGLSTDSFGRAVERWRSAIVLATIGVGVVVLFLNRPPTAAGVVTTLLVVLLVLLAVELLRRPSRER
ncbi:hypothetical protein J4H92_11335 [Leucobacter weissii]|uniref:Uncharacterized protein n=1 Tax=Leucobacter weissii TaxID=1983706 RepID=A0A939MT72_9MICO|nr:hypothetical protein [Leucobacter weissii]MBO1902539.1 hypothetical protein [Leucobacter weissii]